MRHRSFLSTLGQALAALLVVGEAASASTIILATPAGLNPGDKFRFLAVTSGSTTATSTDINTYNTFVQNDFGGATYDSVVVNWKAIGSTSTVNARDNVGGFGSLVPVYKPFTGTLLADNLTDVDGLWSGFLYAPPNETLSESLGNGYFQIHTGSEANGLLDSSRHLGASQVRYGLTGAAFSASWIHSSFITSGSARRMYALSSELTVPSAVPEIDPVGMGSVIAIVSGVLGLLERRRRPSARDRRA